MAPIWTRRRARWRPRVDSGELKNEVVEGEGVFMVDTVPRPPSLLQVAVHASSVPVKGSMRNYEESLRGVSL